MNQNGVTYYYIAWNAVPGRIGSGQLCRRRRRQPQHRLVRLLPGVGDRQEVPGRPREPWDAQARLDRRQHGLQPLLRRLRRANANDIQAAAAAGVPGRRSAPRRTQDRDERAAAHAPTTAWPSARTPATTNYRSIGTAAAYSTGTIAATNGSVTITGTGDQPGSRANRGRGDVIVIPAPTRRCTGGTTYQVLSVDSNTSLTLVVGVYRHDRVGPRYLIRRQYATLTALGGLHRRPGRHSPPAAPAPTSRRRAQASSPTTAARWGSPTRTTRVQPSADINGATTDATHTITLTADPGNRTPGSPGTGVVVDYSGTGRRRDPDPVQDAVRHAGVARGHHAEGPTRDRDPEPR